VSDVPFPYISANQYEKSIRTPLGKTWNPETVHKQLVQPKVVTQMGHVITPIDKAEVFKNEKKTDDKKEQGQDKFKRSKAGNKRHKGKSKGRNK